MCQFRGYLPFCKTLYQMVSLYPFFFMKTLFGLYHVHVSIFTSTPHGIFKNGLFRLFPIQRIINGFFQGAGTLGGLCPIFHIINGTVQAVDGEYAGICHLPFLFHQTPGLFGNPDHFLYAGFPCHSCAIGDMGKLVGIVAKSRNLSKKFCMMLTGLCLQLCA